MSLSNYTDLKSTVANYLGRSDLTTQIPDFISLAELRLQRDIRIRQMLKTSTATMTTSDGIVGIPSDFLQMRDMFIDTNPRTPVAYNSPSVFTAAARSGVGLPTIYTMRGAEFEFSPKPDMAYTLQMLYYFKPAALSSTNPSNEFLANCPDALLYGALLEAEPYLMNDARSVTWANLYNQAIARINASDDESEYAGVPISMRYTRR